MPKRKLEDEEAVAEAELAAAIKAAADAPANEEIAGLGSGTAPLVWKVAPAGVEPKQYKKGQQRGEEPLMFAYLAIRGLGEVPRLMLAEAGAAYTHVAATMAESQAVSLEWRARSPNGLMPMLSGLGVPRATPMSQSGAIVRFLARRYGMDGASELDAINADVLYETAKDFSSGSKQILDDDGEKDAPKGPWALVKRLEVMLEASPSALDSAAALTYGQMALLNALIKLDAVQPGSVLSISPALEEFRVAAVARPRIAAYLASPMCFALTNGDMCTPGEMYNYFDGPRKRADLSK